jgi:hypothetical protein
VLCAAYDGIPFRVLQVEQYADELVSGPDGTQPIMRHVEGQLTATISAETLGLTDLGDATDTEPDIAGPNFKPVVGRLDPAAAVPLVLARLKRPCRPLVMWSYANVGGVPSRVTFLRSPRGRVANPHSRNQYLPTDARHGPTCRVAWSRFEAAQGSLVLGLVFDTDLALCEGSLTASPMLLYNRWSTTVTHDEDYFAQHDVEGTAIFANDLLAEWQTRPDMLRHLFIPPVPIGFKRRAATPVFHSDGVTVTWQVTDVEQQTDKPGIAPFGASRIEVIHRRSIRAPSDWAILKGVGSFLGVPQNG